MDVIGEVIYSLCHFENVRETVADTPGSIELVTRIWLVENTCPVPTFTSGPMNTSALEILLSFPAGLIRPTRIVYTTTPWIL